MADNVIQFPVKNKVVKEVLEDFPSPENEFIHEHLFPWAQKHGVDIKSDKFHHGAAAIISCLQGILLNVN